MSRTTTIVRFEKFIERYIEHRLWDNAHVPKNVAAPFKKRRREA